MNALWRRFELGYIYAHNKISDYAGVICDNDCWIKDEGTYIFILSTRRIKFRT
ncbi:glycoporin [Klebsiella grimontii]|uniref:Glycoporin n=1 Tax=Klebsiella grimontii TaxID=2058152 RepID=A0A7H4PCT4_9ENTR|nr:glycoporin [Klebsiella grimontii]